MLVVQDPSRSLITLSPPDIQKVQQHGTHSTMTNKRPLLPAVQSLPNASRSVGTGLVNDDNNREALTEIPPPSKRRRHRHSAQAWAEQRELFTVLYHHNKKSIKNVIQLIEEERGFKARYVGSHFF